MINTILVIVARILSLVLMPIGIIFGIIKSIKEKRYSEYMGKMALSLDQHANCVCKYLLDWSLRKDVNGSFPFGNEDETISSVLGKNETSGTLTRTGCILVWILDKIDKNHSIKSIDKTE